MSEKQSVPYAEKITVAQLIKELSVCPPDAEVDFSSLSFKRVKPRGPQDVQIEFNQHIYRDNEGQLVVLDLE